MCYSALLSAHCWQTICLFMLNCSYFFLLFWLGYVLFSNRISAICNVLLHTTFFMILGAYGYRYLPNGAVSFNLNEEKENNGTENISVFPIASFLALQFFSSLGVSTVPNMLVSEMFPFK